MSVAPQDPRIPEALARLYGATRPQDTLTMRERALELVTVQDGQENRFAMLDDTAAAAFDANDMVKASAWLLQLSGRIANWNTPATQSTMATPSSAASP